MASNVQQCDVCSEDGSYLEAENWCSECQQWLCQTCSKYHKRLATTKGHTLLSKDEYGKLPKSASDINRKCNKHPENDLEFYCNNHISVVCFTCMKNDHSMCKSVNKLKDVARGVKSSAAVSDIISRLEDSLKTFEDLITDRTKNKQKLSTATNLFDSNIQKVLDDHQKHLTHLASSLRSDLMKKYNEETSALDFENENYRRKKMYIEQKLSETKSMVEYASDIQMFLALEELNKEVSKHEEFLQNLDGKISTKTLELTIDENVSRLKVNVRSFGKVSIQTLKCPVQLSGKNKAIVPTISRNNQQNRQTSSLQSNISRPLQSMPSYTYYLVRKFVIPQPRGKTDPSDIRDMKCLSNGYIAMTDMHNNRVIMIDQYGSVMLQEYFKSSPRCLAFTEDGRLAVTLYEEKKVVVWNPYQPSKKQIIDVEDNCTGIACIGANLVINCQRRGLLLHDLTDDSRRRFPPYTGQFDLSVHGKQGSDVCIFKSKTNDFITLDLKTGKENDSFKIYSKKPSCLANDKHENFYIIDSKNSVRIINPTDMESKVLLDESNGIADPQAVASISITESKKSFFAVSKTTSIRFYIFVANGDNSVLMFERK